MMQQYELSSLRSNHSKGWKTTLLMLSYISETLKDSLPDNDDSENEADSESEEDTL